MPDYDYICDACGYEWTIAQRIKAKKKKKCPNCGKLKAKRLIPESTSFQLKGSGWARDKYG